MDHAQGRAFHHHLARAIMHLNYLAGLLPFFEPSIEWDDPTTDHHLRSGRSNPASRNLHTFVPLPASSTHVGGISWRYSGTHGLEYLRPRTIESHPREEEGHRTVDVTPRNPAPSGGHPSPPALETPKWGTPVPDLPRVTTRTTIPFPVRSKQRSNPIEDPQPKKKQRSTSAPDSTSHPPPLPIISEIPRTGFNSDDSDEDAASKAPSAHETSALETGPTSTTTEPSTTHTTPPPETSTPLVLTPNPTIRIIQPADTARGPGALIRPWTNIEDQELINLKNDTKSRPSWKTIGGRLRRDPQTCKMRWTLLKQMVKNRLLTNQRQKNDSHRHQKQKGAIVSLVSYIFLMFFFNSRHPVEGLCFDFQLRS